MEKIDIKSMTIEEIGQWLFSVGEPSYRAEQIFVWLQSGVPNFEEMSNLPKKLRESLCSNFCIKDVKIEKRLESCIDNTVKYLYRLYDGQLIESVLMKYNHGYSVCISTQVGCKMGCRFCASGLGGFVRNLSASEMLSQVRMAEIDNDIRVSNIVMMGMGEPLDNYDNSIRFLKLVSHPRGMNVGLRHISLSTSGLVPKIKALMEEGLPITLSISLHAPNDKIRSSTMPVNDRWGVDELIKTCKEYVGKTGRRISFEYAVIENVNDSEECAAELAKKLRGMLCHLNLIPANPVVENNFRSPDRRAVERFCERMNKSGINTTVRRTLGADINASCGQLRRGNLK
ncbi:MAG: 23S rRNA (adenine(2503)-C(2))-methyltransferase RlmN [Oscillospiraceae bacterium]